MLLLPPSSRGRQEPAHFRHEPPASLHCDGNYPHRAQPSSNATGSHDRLRTPHAPASPPPSATMPTTAAPLRSQCAAPSCLHGASVATHAVGSGDPGHGSMHPVPDSSSSHPLPRPISEKDR
ncbi:bromodomain-containing protein 4B [Triticum aestivum]|uniref:bromodomain-containing protein 4B n=1 Tax=Triticum aestivum TaxID=4565 RepID=UPI001D02C116|nr:bromodomain-containing protein 4B-like [Triticum aestivum]